MATGLRPPAEGQPYQLDNLVNFAGGLQRTDDTSNVDSTGLIELTNMDPDPRGGLRVRRAVVDQHERINSSGLISHDDVSIKGVTRLARVGNFGSTIGDVIWGNGGKPDAGGLSGRAWFLSLGNEVQNPMAQPAGAVYQLGGYTVAGMTAASASNGARYWPDASFMSGAGTALASGTFEDDYETPTTPGHPYTRYAAVQHYRAWIVDDQLSNRVRFSHPGDPRYWHTDDWVDIGSAASGIIGLYALGDFILAIKIDGMSAILGDTLDAIRIEELNSLLSPFNNVYQEWTHAAGGGVVWAWTLQDGLVSINPQGQLQQHSEQLRRRGILPDIDEISFANNKVWCRSSTDNGTYVYHAQLGAWTFYDIQVRSAIDVFEASGGPAGEAPARVFAIDPTRDLGVASPSDDLGTSVDDEFAIVELEVDQSYDFTSDLADLDTGDNRQIVGSFRTGWIVGGAPTERKRWGRPRVAVESYDNSDIDIDISVYKNYEETLVATTAHAVDVSVDGDVKILRGPSAGRGEAVSYEVASQADGKFADWGVAVLSPRFKRFRVKR